MPLQKFDFTYPETCVYNITLNIDCTTNSCKSTYTWTPSYHKRRLKILIAWQLPTHLAVERSQYCFAIAKQKKKNKKTNIHKPARAAPRKDSAVIIAGYPASQAKSRLSSWKYNKRNHQSKHKHTKSLKTNTADKLTIKILNPYGAATAHGKHTEPAASMTSCQNPAGTCNIRKGKTNF